MYTATAKIEIAAPPEVVRAKFLQWDKLPEYHPSGFFAEFTPLEPNKPIEPGDKLRNRFSIGTFEQTVKENTPECFRWVGGNLATMVGDHRFLFEPSKVTPGGTTFTQYEECTGLLSFIMGDNIVARYAGLHEKIMKGWETYNADLKKWCEESS